MVWLQHWWLASQAKLLTLHGALFATATALDGVLTIFGAYLVYRLERRSGGSASTARNFLAYLLPGKVYLHRSALLDYQIWIVQRIVGFPFTLPGVIGITTLAALLTERGAVAAPAGPVAGLLPTLSCAVLLAVAVDFSNYLGHVIQHKSNFFWEFHKAHHAAEVLTPATLDRTHPIEDLPKILINFVLFAVILVTFNFFHRLDFLATVALGFDILLLMRVVLFYRLRHSHIAMFFPEWLTYVFLAPVHHQTHHSSLTRHFDSNYGQTLALWDRLFGTLVPPEHPTQLRFGLSDNEDVDLNKSMMHLYGMPFLNAWKRAPLTSYVGALWQALARRVARHPHTRSIGP